MLPDEMPRNPHERLPLPTRRYLSLIDQMAESMGRPRGWQTKVADQLGVSQAYVSKLVRGDRGGVGTQVLERAVVRLGIDRRFFYDEAADPSFRAHLVRRQTEDEAEATARAVEEFAATPKGRTATQSELDALREIRFGPIRPNVDMIRDIWREMRTGEEE